MQQTPVAPAADGVARFAPSDDADAPDAGGANLFFVATMYKAPGKAFEKKEYALKARGSLSGDEADGALATFAKATLDLAPHATLDHGAPSRVIRVRLADPRSRAKGVEVALAVAVTWLRNHVQDQDGMTDLSGVSGLSSNRGGESSGASDITGLDSLGGDAAEQDLEGFEEEGAAAKNPEEETSGIASFFGLFGAATSAAAPPMSPIADVDSPSKEMSTPAKRGDERSREERVDDEAPPPPPTVAFGGAEAATPPASPSPAALDGAAAGGGARDGTEDVPSDSPSDSPSKMSPTAARMGGGGEGDGFADGGGVAGASARADAVPLPE